MDFCWFAGRDAGSLSLRVAEPGAWILILLEAEHDAWMLRLRTG